MSTDVSYSSSVTLFPASSLLSWSTRCCVRGGAERRAGGRRKVWLCSLEPWEAEAEERLAELEFAHWGLRAPSSQIRPARRSSSRLIHQRYRPRKLAR